MVIVLAQSNLRRVSSAPDLPQRESDALLRALVEWIDRWRAEHNKTRGGQTELAEALGYGPNGQATIDAAIRLRKRVGAPMAARIYEHLLPVSRETFLARLDGREPPPPTPSDVAWNDLTTWVRKTKGVGLALKKYSDITALDLLRLHASPARHGETDPDDVYGLIRQLRGGPIATIPGSDLDASEVAAQARAARMKVKPTPAT
jgi:hypothetical protein